MRTGVGYDSHRFRDGIPLVLGGVEIPGHPGLAGHSDGDAVAHALIDAILGAAGAGDVGEHFPPSDDRWRGADSLDLLGRAVNIVIGLGFRVMNVDAVVVCESPRIGTYATVMRERISRVLRISPGAVSVKGKTNEGMGWIGSGEGVAVHAVACLVEDGGESNGGGSSDLARVGGSERTNQGAS